MQAHLGGQGPLVRPPNPMKLHNGESAIVAEMQLTLRLIQAKRVAERERVEPQREMERKRFAMESEPMTWGLVVAPSLMRE